MRMAGEPRHMGRLPCSGRLMQAWLYFHRKGETTYRELGLQEVRELPPRGCAVTLEVGGKVAQTRVLDRSAFISYGYQTPRDLSLYLEGV
jgi:hypothetical protein